MKRNFHLIRLTLEKNASKPMNSESASIIQRIFNMGGKTKKISGKKLEIAKVSSILSPLIFSVMN